MPDPARILPTLFLGRAPATEGEVQILRRRGITAVLNLQTDGDLAAMGVSWHTIQEWYGRAGIEGRRVPIDDWSPQAVIAHLEDAVTVLADMLAAGNTVYLHCTAGVNRSPSVALGYMCRVGGESLGRALARLRRARPEAQPYPEVLDLLRRDPRRETR